MKRIASFEVDHDKIGVGMYISRIDDEIITYDVRMVIPNGGKYLSGASMHTIEHLFATYARNRYESNIIYVGPMGCKTGFYLIQRGLSHTQAIELVKDAFRYIRDFDGEIPGATRKECGNYLYHDLAQAKKDVCELLDVLTNYSEENLSYN
ncbi:MAG: S-ribosylhomocysteine lyase [Clostridiales bacterium]|nr:S-ribosylhomocysteine lyase [Clostridiales bacterium]